MAHLLIVEDDNNIQEHLKRKALEINPKLEISITGFAEEAFDILSRNKVDVLFLDIQLLDYNGMILAEKVRAMKQYEFMPIVFITGDPNWAWTAFNEISMCYYLVKPFTDEQIEQIGKKVLLNYIEQSQPEKPQLLLEFKGHFRKVYMSDIVYVESRRRRIYIRFTGEECEYKYKVMTLSKFNEDLSDDFVQIHQAFIINKNYVKAVDRVKHRVNLEGIDKSLPVGSSYRHREKEWLEK